MPADFPDGGRVYACFRRWRGHGPVAEFHDRLLGKVREREGREAEPTAGVIDAQSVPAASRGYDGGKKVTPVISSERLPPSSSGPLLSMNSRRGATSSA